MTGWLEEVELTGPHTILTPLRQSHAPDLATALRDGALHELWYTTVPAPRDVASEIDRRLALQAAGTMLPFAVLSAATGRAVGMTTYMHVDAVNRRVEIGSTFYAPAAQRTGINTDAKRLLLTHAFESLHCLAVEFRTHRMNQQSRRAIERIGAQLDGILRAHMVMLNGTIRDTAVYSITAPEWPAVDANLRALAGRYS